MKRIEAISGGNARQVNVVSLATAIPAIKSSIQAAPVPTMQSLLDAGFEVRIQLRRDTSANWIEVDPVLGEGEIAISTDSGRFKIGDGSSIWTELTYADEHAIAESQEAMQSAVGKVESALPAPLRVDAGEEYFIPSRQQVVFAQRIKLDGKLKIAGRAVKIDTPPPPPLPIHSHANATELLSGFMSASDKLLLDTIAHLLAPTITEQPVASEVMEGEAITYTVEATTLVGSLTYQWQYSLDGINGVDVPGATGTQHEIAEASVSFDGTYVSCVSDNGVSTTRSAWVRQSVFSPLKLGPKLYRWLDSLSNCYQERGVTPTTIAGVGDPVGRVLFRDNTNTGISANADAQRPTKTAQGLLFDGVDDSLYANNTGLAEWTRKRNKIAVYGVAKIKATRAYTAGASVGASVSPRVWWRLGADGVDVLVRAPDSGTSVTTTVWAPSGLSADQWIVYGIEIDFLGGSVQCFVNSQSSSVMSVAVSSATDDSASNRAVIGSLPSLSQRYASELGSMVFLIDTPTTSERSSLINYLAARHGITL